MDLYNTYIDFKSLVECQKKGKYSILKVQGIDDEQSGIKWPPASMQIFSPLPRFISLEQQFQLLPEVSRKYFSLLVCLFPRIKQLLEQLETPKYVSNKNFPVKGTVKMELVESNEFKLSSISSSILSLLPEQYQNPVKSETALIVKFKSLSATMMLNSFL